MYLRYIRATQLYIGLADFYNFWRLWTEGTSSLESRQPSSRQSSTFSTRSCSHFSSRKWCYVWSFVGWKLMLRSSQGFIPSFLRLFLFIHSGNIEQLRWLWSNSHSLLHGLDFVVGNSVKSAFRPLRGWKRTNHESVTPFQKPYLHIQSTKGDEKQHPMFWQSHTKVSIGIISGWRPEQVRQGPRWSRCPSAAAA